MSAVPTEPSIRAFALTRGGAVTARRVADILGGELFLPEALLDDPSVADLVAPAALERDGQTGAETPVTRPRLFTRVGPALQEAFTAPGSEAVVCVMAAGVVVRSLAPVLRDKREDPAVLVIDEVGRFVIPLLSGHLGGANALAEHLARALGAQAVLTTSTDVQGLLGPDLLARDLEADAPDPAAFLPVTSALVNDGEIDLWFDDDEVGGAAPHLRGLPGYASRPLAALGETAPRAGIVLTTRPLPPVAGGPLLHLVPRWVVAGVGCKRGTSMEALVEAVQGALQRDGRHPSSLRALASARVKSDETGLFAAAERLGVPVVFARDEELAAEIAAAGLEESAFVREQAGVGAVAEPAALWAAGEGARLILEKQAADGITVALALMDGARIVSNGQGRWR